MVDIFGLMAVSLQNFIYKLTLKRKKSLRQKRVQLKACFQDIHYST